MSEVEIRVEPVRKEILVPGNAEEVFGLFTTRMNEWWPTVTHSVSGEEAARVMVESGVGGRIYEVTSAGEEHEWGRFTTWEEGERLDLTWHPGLSADQSTRIAIGFQAEGRSTRVTLVHDGWEARGVNGPTTRDDYHTGWDHVLGQIPDMSPL